MPIEKQDNTRIIGTHTKYLDNRTEELKLYDKELEYLNKLDSEIKENLKQRQLLFDLSLSDDLLQSKIEKSTGFKFSPAELVTYNGRTYNDYATLFKDLRGQGNKEFYWTYTVKPKEVPLILSDEEYKKYLYDTSILETLLRLLHPDITSSIYQDRSSIEPPATYQGRTIPLSKAVQYREADKKSHAFNTLMDNALATLVSAPLLMYGTASAPLALGLSYLGGEAVDETTKYFTGDDWGTYASKLIGINPQGELSKTIMPWTNPGYLLGAVPFKMPTRVYSREFYSPRRSMISSLRHPITEIILEDPATSDPFWGKYHTAEAFAKSHPEYIKTYTVDSYVKDPSDPNLKTILYAQDIYYKDLVHLLGKQKVTRDFNRRNPNYNPYNNRVIKFIEYKSNTPAGKDWIGSLGSDGTIYVDRSFALSNPEFLPESILIHEAGGHGLAEDLFAPNGYLRSDNNLAVIKVLANMRRGFLKDNPLETSDIRLTPLELKYTEKAIPLNKEYIKEYNIDVPLEEAARTAYDARIYLSLLNDNIIGKKLDDKINSLSMEEAINLLDNTSGYGENAIEQVRKMTPAQQKEWLENFKKLMYYSIGISIGTAFIPSKYRNTNGY